MPIYEYGCEDCGITKEVFGHMTDEADDIAPTCECGDKMKRNIFPCSIQMKRKTIGDLLKERKDDPNHVKDPSWFYEQSRKKKRNGKN